MIYIGSPPYNPFQVKSVMSSRIIVSKQLSRSFDVLEIFVFFAVTMIFFLSLNTQYWHTDEDWFSISTNFGISTRIQRLQSAPQGGFTIFYLERFVYSQMVLPFEGFRAELTHVFSLVTVCELMLCQSAWVVEVFTTYWTLSSIWPRWHRILTGPSFWPRLDFRSIFRS